MAFTKKTWVDRLVEFAGRRKLTNVSTGSATVYNVERAEGVVQQEGTAFSAANMNDLETRIEKAINNMTAKDVNAVSKSGDTMTGDLTLSGAARQVKYASGARTGIPIAMYKGDANGSGLVIGDGGRTIIGGGESAENLRTALGTATTNESAEEMHVAGDGTVQIHSNCQTINSRKTFTFNTDGTLSSPAGFRGSLLPGLTGNRALVSNSSGGVAVSSVTSTELGYLDGVTKNIQTQLNTINVYVGSDGKIHFKNSAGADTALPFSKGASGTFINTSKATVNCGFKPKAVACINLNTERRSMCVYYNGTQYFCYSNQASTVANKITINNTGFVADFTDSGGWQNCTIAWFAIP